MDTPNTAALVVRAQHLRTNCTEAYRANPAAVNSAWPGRGSGVAPGVLTNISTPSRIAGMAIVTLTPEAAEQLEALTNPIHRRVLKLLVRMESWPDLSGVKPLSDELAGHYRLRTGDYRVQFLVEGDNLIVEKIGHRDGFYEE
jgi:mRNA-degrading endonuclease RelE of RelBE toxin-antitoxin system